MGRGAFPLTRPALPVWHPATLLSTWFGAGLLPKAPGTWGSLAALPFAWVMVRYGGPALLALAVGAVFLIGWWAAATYVRGGPVADPGEVVIDEVAGQWLALAFVPPDPVLYLTGFVLFRLFDIRKPWPVGWADRTVAGGLGIMVDDILAGLYAAAFTAIVAYWR
jgi:phosphatidylglycerophosphatase A